MTDIFLSYAREDIERIRPIVQCLEKQGWSVFWDQDIGVGQAWRSRIDTELVNATCVVVAWSDHAIRSDFVIQEAEEAKKRDVLVPLRLDPIQSPLGFRELQVADLSSWEPNDSSSELNRLLEAIRKAVASRPSKQDIRSKHITPALTDSAGWDLHRQISPDYLLKKGRILIRGQRGVRDKKTEISTDYALFWKPGIPLAVIEIDDADDDVGSSIHRAMDYARLLDVPFAFSSNGAGFVFHDGTLPGDPVATEIALNAFPSPKTLWQKLQAWKGYTANQAEMVEEDYAPSQAGKPPRYYQLAAVNRTIEAIARGDRRVLLVMATGTGKTFTAFQIIWRLWKSSWLRSRSRENIRILFLADRNILVDQARINDFKLFKDKMTKLSPQGGGIEGSGRTKVIDKSYEIYLSLYQAVSSAQAERDIYKQFSPDFFDLVVVDECHRGSAAEDSAWREILDYFSDAIHLGLTATPKETETVSNITYFGDPVYTYSLKQGIEDGFLAPYKVIRIDIDSDLGWRPAQGMLDRAGEPIEDRVYNRSDINRHLILTSRDILVADRITAYLRDTDPYGKAIVFCEDQDHAARMRQALRHANADLVAQNDKYVVRITGEDTAGRQELDNFIDPEKTYPVIATTSKLLTTGVDAQTCKLIVLDQNINSMTDFKQIIGRGTRINEDYGKTWFTIIDFKRATELFADPAFDGDPVVVYEPTPDDPIQPEDDDLGDGPDDDDEDGDDINGGRRKIVVDGVDVSIVREQVQYIGPDGKLITESLRDYARILINRRFTSLDGFVQRWSDADKKTALIDELERQGVIFDELEKAVGKDLDPFDLILHVAYGQKPLTRKERAEKVKKRDYFGRYGETARKVLERLLDKYADEGIANIENINVLKIAPISDLGAPVELIRAFGGRAAYQNAVHELGQALYH